MSLTASTSTDKRPNVLLVMTDQHRLSACGAYGPTPCTTPHIDALARRGMLFNQAYCPTAICSPARASLLTGMLPHRHGMTANIGDLGCNQPYIADDPRLLSRRLEAAGVRCGYTGKWHLCAEHNKRTRYQADYPMSLPTTLGFTGHDFAGHGGGGFGDPIFQRYLDDNNLSYDVDRIEAAFGHEAGIWRGPIESTVPYFLADHTMHLIDRLSADADDDQPWFIWHNNWGPHEPYFVPQEWYDRYRDVDIPPWPDFTWDANSVLGPHRRWLPAPQHDWQFWQELLRYYYAFASFIDDQIGRMVAHLAAIGQLENTIIIMTADHGESLGSHGGLANKGVQAFEETLRVPLVIAGPGVYVGAECDQLVSNMDLHETVCDWQGATPVADLQSRSLAELCRGQQPTQWRDCWVTESHGIVGFLCTQRVLRWRNWSYCWSAGFPELLFDLDADPHQVHNLADNVQHIDALQACRQRLDEWMQDERDHSRPAFQQDRSLWAAHSSPCTHPAPS